MTVIFYRQTQTCLLAACGRVVRPARVETVEALHARPAVIAAASHPVDFLAAILSDVPEPKVARRSVETKTPRISEAIREYFLAHADVADERVAGGNGILQISIPAVGVNAENRAEERSLVLSVFSRVIGAAAIAKADVEKSVGAEGQHAAVVVGGNLVDLQEEAFTAGVGGISRGRKFRDDCPQRRGGTGRVVDIEAAVLAKVGMEGETEQAHFAAGSDPVADIEEDRGSGNGRIVGKHPNTAGLLHDEKATTAVAAGGEKNRIGECQVGEGFYQFWGRDAGGLACGHLCRTGQERKRNDHPHEGLLFCY